MPAPLLLVPAMDPISLEELSLLEALLEVDQAAKEQLRVQALHERLVDSGLVAMEGGELKLTAAGVERTKSLQHRVRADREAAEVLKDREQRGETEAMSA